MSDRLRAWLRTIVPGLWSALVAWLASLGLPESVLDAINGLGHVVVFPVVLAVVYAAIRWAEERLPDWLTRILAGSAQQPVYDPEIRTAQQHLEVLDGFVEMGRAAERRAAQVRSGQPKP